MRHLTKTLTLVLNLAMGAAWAAPPDPGLAGTHLRKDDVKERSTEHPPQHPNIVPPPQVSNYVLHWNDEFETLDLYHPTNNPNGRWRYADFWMDPTAAGYVDFAAQKTFNVNQVSTEPAIQPYKPLSVSNGILRITARRARLNERPALGTVVNDIARSQDPDLVDKVTWLGAWISAYRVYQSPQEFIRNAYVEARVKWTPGTNGLGSAFWVFASRGDAAVHPTAEIDICDLIGFADRWYTHVHLSSSGPSHEQENVQSYSDDYHVYGLHWTDGVLRIYRDNVLMPGQWTGDTAGWFKEPMRVILSLGADMTWLPEKLLVPGDIEELYMDVDWVRVWVEP